MARSHGLGALAGYLGPGATLMGQLGDNLRRIQEEERDAMRHLHTSERDFWDDEYYAALDDGATETEAEQWADQKVQDCRDSQPEED